jgi:predicted nucleotidyltransferase
MALVNDLARRLKRAGAERVVLFGSLADGRFTRGSDIDLAVSGLSERALARLEHEFTILAGRPVELANLGSMPESLLRNVNRFGSVLV